jgi:hypothetical protein
VRPYPVRDDGDAQSCRNQRNDAVEPIQLKTVAWHDAAATQIGVHKAAAPSASVISDEHLSLQQHQRIGLTCTGRCNQHERFGDPRCETFSLAKGCGRLDHDRGVEHPIEHAFAEFERCPRFDEDVEVRVHLSQSPQERRQQPRAGGLDRPQPQFARNIPLIGREALEIGGPSHQRPQWRKQASSRGRGSDPPPGPSNERRSQLRLHHLDPQRDGPWGQTEPASGTGDRAFLNHSNHSSGKVRVQRSFPDD